MTSPSALPAEQILNDRCGLLQHAGFRKTVDAIALESSRKSRLLNHEDLVVEVLSPSDRPGATLAKVADWLSAGARLVWVLDPARRLARVYRHDGSEQILTADESLDGEDVVPGFSCPLGDIL